jgi:CubicO group peptidase (beta-lactamase class C family)
MRRSLLILALALSIPVRPLNAEDLLSSRFGEYLESLRVQAGIPGLAAAVIGANGVLWERAFGHQDTEKSIAVRPDTPFHLDGLTQLFTSALVLRCVEEGRLSLDDRVGQFKPSSPDAGATLGQILTHTSGPPDNLTFAYRPERLDPLTRAIRKCTNDSFRETLSNLIERLAMIDSAPGPDIIYPERLTEGIPTPSAVQRYKGVLGRLATPYNVDEKGRASPSQYPATTLAPASGLISTVRDFARFDFALKQGVLLRADTLAKAWSAPVGRDGRGLPHGLGWFVQYYNGETIVWQFGFGASASSALAVTIPSQGLTLVLLANSDGLVEPSALTSGDLTNSPFGQLFLRFVVR